MLDCNFSVSSRDEQYKKNKRTLHLLLQPTAATNVDFFFVTAVRCTYFLQLLVANMMMMIAFIIIKSGLVPLIEALCALIYLRFEISVVLLTFSSCLFRERKKMLKENKKAVSPLLVV